MSKQTIPEEYKSFFEAAKLVCHNYNINFPVEGSKRFRALLLDEYQFASQSQLREVFCRLENNGIVMRVALLPEKKYDYFVTLIEEGETVCDGFRPVDVAAVVFAVADAAGFQIENHVKKWFEEYNRNTSFPSPTDTTITWSNDVEIGGYDEIESVDSEDIINGPQPLYSSNNNHTAFGINQGKQEPSAGRLWLNFILVVIFVMVGIMLINKARGGNHTEDIDYDSAVTVYPTDYDEWLEK